MKNKQQKNDNHFKKSLFAFIFYIVLSVLFLSAPFTGGIAGAELVIYPAKKAMDIAGLIQVDLRQWGIT